MGLPPFPAHADGLHVNISDERQFPLSVTSSHSRHPAATPRAVEKHESTPFHRVSPPPPGVLLRPEPPASPPDPGRGRVHQIHIPLIIAPPRQPNRQPHRHPVRTAPPNRPAIPMWPGSHGVPVMPSRPVVETGEAGPPGFMRRVTVRRGSEDSADSPLIGVAGAPGRVPISAEC